MNKFIEKINDYCSKIDFSGVVSIFKEDETIYSNAFGFMQLSNQLENNTSTSFGIASGTKTFTALGILRLIEEGVITYSTTIDDIFNEKFSFIDGSATIQQLLCHKSGMYDYYDEELIEDFDNFEVKIPWYKLDTPHDYLPLFINNKYKFKPGLKFSYSNGAYVFLGVIIEKLTNMKYRDYIESKILTPMNMNSSGFYAFNNLPINTATGYMNKNKELVSNIYQLPIRGGGDGGMYTNTFDMKAFWANLFSYEILSEEHLKRFINTEVDFSENSGYGLGIYTSNLENERCYSASGCDAGVGFISTYIPSKKIIINIFSNFTNGDEEIKRYIYKIITEIY